MEPITLIGIVVAGTYIAQRVVKHVIIPAVRAKFKGVLGERQVHKILRRAGKALGKNERFRDIMIPGKTQNKKNLTDIIAAHNVPYVAQTTFIGNFRDLYTKAKKAIYTPGPSFLNVMSPCPRGWEYPTEKLPEICKLAVETCVWPLFEVIDGVWHLSYEPKQKRPVEEYLRMQGRFRHMFKPGNEWMIEAVQQNVDENWEKLLNRCNQ